MSNDISDDKGWDFERFRQANAGHEVSRLDYASNMLRGHLTHADGVLAVAAFFWPEFRLVDGLVLIDALYTDGRLAELRAQGLEEHEVEFWMNLFSVDGFFEGLPGDSVQHAEALAETIANSWNAKAATQFPEGEVRARILRDDDVGDIAVTLERRRLG
jgi:hypothetical protein